MIYIILKNRKVLQYNTGDNVSRKDGVVLVLDSQAKWIAQIPIDNIERVEAIRPCAVLKAKAAKGCARYCG